MRRSWIASLAISVAAAACHFSSGVTSDATRNDANPGDGGPIDAAWCALPALSLHVATLAGCDVSGDVDGPRAAARFTDPANVALGLSGEAYVADYGDNVIRKIDVDGTTTTLVKQATFSHPFGLAFTPEGQLYVETDDDDQGNTSNTSGTIWLVDPSTGSAGVVARDQGQPRGLALLPDGTLAVADPAHQVVELFDPIANPPTMVLIAGMMDVSGHVNASGGSAEFATPWAVVPFEGDLLVTDRDNQVVRRVTLAGVVTDYAGTGSAGHADGTLTSSLLSSPKGIAIDQASNVYVSEAGNHDVRELSGTAVTTVAGDQQAGWMDDNDAAQAEFYAVEGLAVTADGTRIVIADGNAEDGRPHNHVREVH
jgi:sugar lactone lactonase YvrE